MNRQRSGLARLRPFAFALSAALATLAMMSGFDVAFGNASLFDAAWLLVHFMISFSLMYFALYMSVLVVRGTSRPERGRDEG